MQKRPSLSRNQTGHPYALAILWVVLMVPCSLAMRLVQPLVGISDVLLPLVMLGPLLAAIVCWMTVPQWFPPQPPSAPKTAKRRSWLSTMAVVVIIIGACLVSIPTGDNPVLPEGWSGPWAALALIICMSFGSWAEEAGYRGVMYRALSAKVGPWVNVVINGVFFGLCHIQYFTLGPWYVLLFVLSTVLLDIAMASVWAGSWKQRVVTCATIHAALNIAFQATANDLSKPEIYYSWVAVISLAAVVAFLLGRWCNIGDFVTRERA